MFAHNEIVIPGVAPEVVFGMLVRAGEWPRFYDNSADISSEPSPVPGALSELRLGSRFTWKTFGVRQKSEVTLYERARALGWTADSPGTHAYHRWLLLAEGDGTRVITEECQTGPLAWVDSFVMNPSLHASHQLWLERLKQVALGREQGREASPY